MAGRDQRLPSIDAWQAVQLRVTLFGTVGSQVDVADWWKTVTGQEPDSVTDQPKAGSRLVQGSYMGAALALTAALNRYSWDLSSAFDIAKGVEDFPKIGPFPTSRDAFLRGIKSWLTSHAPSTVRIAFGAQAMISRQSKTDSYELLSGMLGMPLDAERTGDFQYRINRYATSVAGQPGLRINRLRTWQAMTFKLLGSIASMPHVVHEQSACVVELDINTDAERTEPFKSDQLPLLLTELEEFGTDIIAGGERD